MTSRSACWQQKLTIVNESKDALVIVNDQESKRLCVCEVAEKIRWNNSIISDRQMKATFFPHATVCNTTIKKARSKKRIRKQTRRIWKLVSFERRWDERVERLNSKGTTKCREREKVGFKVGGAHALLKENERKLSGHAHGGGEIICCDGKNVA